MKKFDELAKPVIELLDTISEKVNKIDAEKLNKQLNKFNVKNLVDHYFNKRRFDEKMADKDDVKNNNTL